MSEMRCETVQERIPDFVTGRVTPYERAAISGHLEKCRACRAEADLVSLLAAGRPAVPEGLAHRIVTSVRVRPGAGARPWWGAAAAAVAALALGIGVTSTERATEVEVPAYVAGVEGTALWMDDDGLVAGAPALADLSDEALETLLDEMTSSGTGGAV